VGDRQELEGGERADDQVDVVALDQLLGLRLRPRGIPAGVAHDELGLAAGERVVPVLEEAGHPLLHLDAALGQRTGLHGEQAEANRFALGTGWPRQCRGESRADQEAAAIESERHWLPPGIARRAPRRPSETLRVGLLRRAETRRLVRHATTDRDV